MHYKTNPKNKNTMQQNKQNSLSGTATVENEAVHRSLLAARIANDHSKNGKRAGEDAPPVNIGWNSHEAVVSFIHLLTFPRMWYIMHYVHAKQLELVMDAFCVKN